MRIALDAGGAPVLGGNIGFNPDNVDAPRYCVASKNTAGGGDRAACAERERYFRAHGRKAKATEMCSRFCKVAAQRANTAKATDLTAGPGRLLGLPLLSISRGGKGRHSSQHSATGCKKSSHVFAPV